MKLKAIEISKYMYIPVLKKCKIQILMTQKKSSIGLAQRFFFFFF